MTDLKQLPPPEKKVASKVLIEHGYSSRKVKEILGISYQTALNYAQEPIPEEKKEFLTIFDNYIKECEQKGLKVVYDRLLTLIPRERRIDQVVKAGEFLKGTSQQKQQGINNLIQINVNTGESQPMAK